MKKESKRYKITVKLKKPYTFVDEFLRYPSRDFSYIFDLCLLPFVIPFFLILAS